MAFAQNPELWLFIAAFPTCIYVVWSDLARMKIPNIAVLVLIATYAVVGFLVLPFDSFVWRWLHLPVVLVIGIAANAAGVLGAGDAKFMAAAAPFVALFDLSLVLVLLSGCLLIAVGTHRLAKASFGPRMAPHWASWRSGRKFPMGFPLAMTLLAYLVIVAASR